MKKKFFTVEDLINFCKKEKKYNFSSKESGGPIVVQSIQDFSDAEIEESDDGKLYAKVRVCHTLLNRNNSYISEESMVEAMPTLKYSPLLASIHQLDNKSWDFHSHDFHTEKDDEGNEYDVYDERQVGTFTADEPYLEYDKKKNKTYVVAKVAIPTEYTRAAEIIKEKGGTKVSCELLIYDCSFNVKEHYLELDHFRFNGCTCLGSEKDGTPIGEGMEGSFLSLEDFSEDNNSYLKFIENKLNTMQSTLDDLNARFNTKNTKGGTELRKENFEEEVTTEEVTDTEETEEEVTNSEEEIEETVEETSEDEPESDDNTDDDVDEEAQTENESENNTTVEYSFISNGETKKFAVSLQDKIYAIQDLVNATYAESDNTYYGVTVYDDYVIMQDWWNGRYFKQSYDANEDNYSLTGDRVEVYVEFVTSDEQKELDEMRSNYAELKEFKENVEKNELHSKREEIINSEKYAILAQKDEEGNFVNKDFENLISEMDNYSLADLETKIKVLHSDYVSEHSNFSATTPTEENKKTVSKKQFVNVNKKPATPSRYGKLFEKEDK